MNDKINRMNQLEALIKDLNRELSVLRCEVSQYYIGKTIIGDGSYWDEYYDLLGYTTEDKVYKWRNEQLEHGCYDVEYFAVSKEEYYKYKLWYNLDNITSCFRMIRDEDYAHGKDFVKDTINTLLVDLRINYPSFMHIGEEYNL